MNKPRLRLCLNLLHAEACRNHLDLLTICPDTALLCLPNQQHHHNMYHLDLHREPQSEGAVQQCRMHERAGQLLECIAPTTWHLELEHTRRAFKARGTMSWNERGNRPRQGSNSKAALQKHLPGGFPAVQAARPPPNNMHDVITKAAAGQAHGCCAAGERQTAFQTMCSCSKPVTHAIAGLQHKQGGRLRPRPQGKYHRPSNLACMFAHSTTAVPQ